MKMKQARRKIIPLFLLLGLLLAGLTAAAAPQVIDGSYTMRSRVVAGGGGPLAAGAYDLNGTAGQETAATSSGASYTLQSGYWAGVEVEYSSHLPLLTGR